LVKLQFLSYALLESTLSESTGTMSHSPCRKQQMVEQVTDFIM